MAISAKHKASLGKKLRMARENRKISQRQVALALEVTNASISDIENGINFPSEALLLKLITHLNPPDKLRMDIYRIYAEAKDAPPPDITVFLKGNTELQELLRELATKEMTSEGMNNLRKQIRAMEDKKYASTE